MPTRNQLIEDSLKYARAAATKFTLGAHPGSAQWKDAYSEACVALVKAADDWDPNRGVLLSTFAWPRMMRAIQKMREGQLEYWAVQTTSIERSGDDDQDEFHADLVDSPEDLMLEAERRAVVRARLSRVSFADRRVVEDVLDGKSAGHAKPNAARIAYSAGVRVAASDIPPKDSVLTGAERERRRWRRMSADARDRRNATKRARRAAERAA